MNKELQKKRIKNYFIEAAKDIVKKEGLSNVNIRKTAEIAGYSYATIYNYFTDLNHLLWHVTISCSYDMVKSLSSSLDREVFKLIDIIEIYKKYVEYFINNKNFFELLFFNQIGEAPEEFQNESSDPKLAMLLLEKLNDPENCRPIKKDEIFKLAQIITSSVHGHLSLFFSNKTGEKPEEILIKINIMLDYLLR